MMGGEQFDRVQQLFLAALELAEGKRDAWLREQCGDDLALLEEVRSLLKHDSPANDPLEDPLDVAICDPDRTVADSETSPGATTRQSREFVNGDEFLSRLSDVEILSADELREIEKDLSGEDASSNPRALASKLVTAGKLTEYQAAALLKGRPALLIDKYLIMDLIETGGMGIVFKAIHRPMNRVVAVKMIAKRLLASPEQVQRFLREVRVAATLENVNVVRAYDADQSKGIHFLVMEYVRGENLANIVRRDGPLTLEQAIDCIGQAANGLRYAHRRGVVHRDIKPNNLMRTDEGLVKVLDLGLADVDESFRLVQQQSVDHSVDGAEPRFEAEDLTEAGTVLGTASFMAPEQSRDAGSADIRSDIYGLGCTLYYLLIGEAPYKGDTSIQILAQHRNAEIPFLQSRRTDVPPSLEAICRRMMAKSPGDRFQSLDDVISAITDCEIAPSEGKDKPRTNVLAESPGAPPHESRRGRVERLLAERAVLWNARPQNRHLPTWREYAEIRFYSDQNKWTPAQHKMMGSAGLALGLRLGLLVLLMTLISLIGLRVRGMIAETEDATRAAGLVEMLKNTKIGAVPIIVSDLEDLREWSYPLLRSEITKYPAGSEERLHLALGLLPSDESQVDYLSQQLSTCTQAELPVLCDALEPHEHRITNDLWQFVADEHHSEAERFQTAVALSQLAPGDKRWESLSDFVAEHLTSRVTNMSFGSWSSQLQLVREALIVPLAQIHADRDRSERQREAAALLLADYCHDKPAQLVSSILVAENLAEYSPLIDALRPHASVAKNALSDQLQAEMPNPLSVEQRDAYWTRRAISAVTLLQFGHTDDVWPLLRFSPDPSFRSMLIYYSGQLQADPLTIANRLTVETDTSVRRALIQILGGLDASRLPKSDRHRIEVHLRHLYVNDADPGVHNSASLTLRRWGVELPGLKKVTPTMADEQQAATDRDKSVGPTLGDHGAQPANAERAQFVAVRDNQRRWYVNREGQTMITLHPSETDSSSVHHSFAICDREVTVAEFLRFRDDHVFAQATAPTHNCPVAFVDHYAAAAYCNWLSKQNGIPTDQWVYEPNGYGKFAEGMRIKDSYKSLMGYRLPTGAEWEYACRAGTKGSYSFGEPETLLPQYANTGRENLVRSEPVASRLPNDFGLFDVHGNVWEKVEDPVAGSRSPIRDDILRQQRGGSFATRQSIPSNYFQTVEPKGRRDFTGFRTVVSIPAVQSTKPPGITREAPHDGRDNSRSRYALLFDGEHSFGRIRDLSFDGSYPITLEAVVTPLSTRLGQQSVVANCEHAGIALGLQASNWVAVWAHRSSSDGGASYAVAKSSSRVVLGRRVHVAAVFTAQHVTLFVDGEKMETALLKEHFASRFGFYVGAAPSPTDNPHQFFNGKIEKVRISRVARYSSNFKPSEQFLPDADTLVLYQMNEGVGNKIKDDSGNGHDGWIEDTVWSPMPPIKTTDGE